MKLFIITLFLASNLLAFEHNSLLLRAQASVFAKILLLDKEISKKTENKNIIFSLVHNQDELESAQKLNDLLFEKTQGKIGSYTLDVKLLDVKDYTQTDNSTAYYLFNIESDSKKRVVQDAKNKNRICYSYDYKDFKYGSLISLYFKEKTYVYLNKESLLDYGIKFNPVLYKIVKVK